jgi:hypothetical protein
LTSLSLTLDLTREPRGIYFYRLLSEDGKQLSVGKLVFQ